MIETLSLRTGPLMQPIAPSRVYRSRGCGTAPDAIILWARFDNENNLASLLDVAMEADCVATSDLEWLTCADGEAP
jgi:hypothetical protein